MKKLIISMLLMFSLYGCEDAVSDFSEHGALYLNSYDTNSIYHLVFQKDDGEFISLRIDYGDEAILDIMEEGSNYDIEYYIAQYGSIKTFTLRKIKSSNKADI